VDTQTGQYLHLLARGDPGDRRKAAKELRRHLCPPVIAGLIIALERDDSHDVRKEAASSLGQLLARDAEPALRLAAREDQDGGVRKAALTSARKIQAAYGIVP
jgi:HEAT repeat protein